MHVVIDANILFSFFRKDSLVREIIIDSDLKYNLEIIAPKYALEELDKHKKEICEKAQITEEDYEFPRGVLEFFIEFISEEMWVDKIEEASKLLAEHKKDVPYLALALKYNCSVWSYDKNIKKQNKVKVCNTKEILELI